MSLIWAPASIHATHNLTTITFAVWVAADVEVEVAADVEVADAGLVEVGSVAGAADSRAWAADAGLAAAEVVDSGAWVWVGAVVAVDSGA